MIIWVCLNIWAPRLWSLDFGVPNSTGTPNLCLVYQCLRSWACWSATVELYNIIYLFLTKLRQRRSKWWLLFPRSFSIPDMRTMSSSWCRSSNAMDCPYFDGLYVYHHILMVNLGMVYYRFTNIKLFLEIFGSWLSNLFRLELAIVGVPRPEGLHSRLFRAADGLGICRMQHVALKFESWVNNNVVKTIMNHPQNHHKWEV